MRFLKFPPIIAAILMLISAIAAQAGQKQVGLVFKSPRAAGDYSSGNTVYLVTFDGAQPQTKELATAGPKQWWQIDAVDRGQNILLSKHSVASYSRAEKWLLYQFPAGKTIKLDGKLANHEARVIGPGKVAFVKRWQQVGNPEVTVLDMPTGRLEKSPFSRLSLPEKRAFCGSSFSPDVKYSAFVKQEFPKGNTKFDVSSMLVIKDRVSGAEKVLVKGIFPGQNRWRSDTLGPSLAWASACQIVYTDQIVRDGKRFSLCKVVDINTGAIKTLADSSKGQPCPSWRGLKSDLVSGRVISEITSRGKDGKYWRSYWAYNAVKDKVAFDRRQISPRYQEVHDKAHRTVMTLQDSIKGADAWRGGFALLGRWYPSPDEMLLAYSARPNGRADGADIFIYDSRTGKSQKVFSNARFLGEIWWVGY